MTDRRSQMTIGRADATPPRIAGTVSVRYLQGIVEFAVQCGADRGELLTTVGIASASMSDPEARLPLGVLPDLFARCSALLDDPSFALRFGVGVPCAQLTLAGVMASATPTPAQANPTGPAPTLRDALDGLNRYASLGVDFGLLREQPRFRYVEDVHGVWLEDCRPYADHESWAVLTESVFSRFATSIRKRAGESIVRALQVTHRMPHTASHLEAYAHVFRVPVHFTAPRNALCLDPAFLEQPLEPLPVTVRDVLTRHADSQLQRLRMIDSWSVRVTAHLHTHFESTTRHSSAPGILDQICRELAVSRQTLHRRLQREQTTFVALLDEVRRTTADTLLRDEALTIDAIATRLGFSEAAAFSRAYKRWTGRRPGAVKRAG